MIITNDSLETTKYGQRQCCHQPWNGNDHDDGTAHEDVAWSYTACASRSKTAIWPNHTWDRSSSWACSWFYRTKQLFVVVFGKSSTPTTTSSSSWYSNYHHPLREAIFVHLTATHIAGASKPWGSVQPCVERDSRQWPVNGREDWADVRTVPRSATKADWGHGDRNGCRACRFQRQEKSTNGLDASHATAAKWMSFGRKHPQASCWWKRPTFLDIFHLFLQ